jgi:hypothetical protein
MAQKGFVAIGIPLPRYGIRILEEVEGSIDAVPAWVFT